MKLCSKCKIEKPSSDFWSARTTADKLQGWCKPCATTRVKEYRSEHPLDPEKAKVYNRKGTLKYNYNMTPDEYETLLVAQGGGCIICRRIPEEGKRRLHVDHDHSTGSVRGILCHTCNVGLGMFKNNPELLRLASDYVSH